MWKLEIKQKKDCGGYSIDEIIVYESENVEDLIGMIEYISKLKPVDETSYTISQKGEEG